MKRTYAIFAVVFALLFLSLWFLLRAQNGSGSGVIYRTAEVRRGDATRSFTASGVLQPLTTVDVKSKAGGEVVRLAVEEGDFVRKGDVIAEIDPRDTRAIYDQAVADLSAAESRKRQNELSLEMQKVQSKAAVASSESSLRSAKLRLKNLEERARIQPDLTRASIAQAQANYDTAVQALGQLEKVTVPQTRAQVEGDCDRTKADLDASKANYDRQQQLFEKGYVSQSAVDQAKSSYQAAVASNRNANERLRTLEQDLEIQINTAKARIAQAKASLDQAKVNEADIGMSERDLEDAREAVYQAEASLEQAKANRKQVDLRAAELDAADAAIIRSRVAMDNAKVQLDSTTVVAPRDGIVIQKYLEEGTIVTPGASAFAEGSPIVQIADVSRMYVEVYVDEADVGMVQVGQTVRVALESNPGMPLNGTVSRINPSAVATGGLTQVKVRVEVETPSADAEGGERPRRGPGGGSGEGRDPSGMRGQGGGGFQMTPEMRERMRSGDFQMTPEMRERMGSMGGRRRGGSGPVKLMPGLNASCEFIISETTDVLVIPANAIQRDGEQTYVEVMVEKDKPVRRDVEVGARGDTMIEIVEGLEEGEIVVTSKIDRKQIEEQDRRMEEAAQQRNPFSGGTRTRGR
ncbi:MAG: HlyD family efflux transporter periplasmic adaptor subunit [Armatimonadetes bacterium]|nr:HlyD family efflux transporter periplasmic adaptor subunit [Armatimonadota bacterium]